MILLYLACITDDGVVRDPGPPPQGAPPPEGPADGPPNGQKPGGKQDEAPATAAKADGLTGWLTRPDQASTLMITGETSQWWSRKDGAMHPGPPIQGIVDLAPDGRVWLVDGERVSVADAATPAKAVKITVPKGTVAFRAQQDKVAFLGDTTVVHLLETGEERTLPGAVIGGWVGDRLYTAAADGVVVSWNPNRPAEDAPVSVGKLPVVPDRAHWTLLGDGTWMQVDNGTATLYPPAALTDPRVRPRVLQLPTGSVGVAPLGRDRYAAFGPSGVYLFDRGKPVSLAGDLLKPTPELLTPFAP